MMATAIQILLVIILLIFLLFFILIILDDKDDKSDPIKIIDAQLKAVFDNLDRLNHRVRKLEDKINNEQ